MVRGKHPPTPGRIRVILRLYLYVLAICLVVGIMIGGSWALGPARRGLADQMPFESGILPLHGTNTRNSNQFYLIAMFFVIFDLEMVFVLAWAVAVRPAGWFGYAGMLAFLALLLAALMYLWRAGGLDWRTGSMRVPSANKRDTLA
jgi:NADH-quinone oxidoreductase subunit A